MLHTAIARADLVGRLAAIGTKIPVISSLVNTPYTSERLSDPAVRRWKLRAFQLADALTARLLVTRFHAVTPGVRDHAVRHMRIRPDRILVIERGRSAPSSANSPDIAGDDRLLVTSDRHPLLLAVGRQEFQKGFDIVVASIALLSKRRSVQLLIAGREGNASEELRTLTQRLGVGKSVQFLGQRQDVDDLLAAADVFVLSSRYEGTAGAALEAMAARTPIVSTRLEGTTGILIHDHNALVVEPNDPSALAHALEALLTDPTLGTRLATQALQDFTSRFNMERHVERMADLYRTTAIVGRRGRAIRRTRRLGQVHRETHVIPPVQGTPVTRALTSFIRRRVTGRTLISSGRHAKRARATNRRILVGAHMPRHVWVARSQSRYVDGLSKAAPAW